MDDDDNNNIPSSSTFNRISFMTTKSISVDNIQQLTTANTNANANANPKPYTQAHTTSQHNNTNSNPNAVQVDSSLLCLEDNSMMMMNQLQSSNTSTYDHFIDVQLDKSNSPSDPFKDKVIPYLEIEEKEIKKDYFDSYIKYEISLISGPNTEKSILSYRRYDNFHSFYTRLKYTYPYYIYPILSKKNIFTKLFTDTEFNQRRKKQLKYFLNYLFNHPKLKATNEFLKFIKDPEFDDEYFKEKPPKLYPESHKQSSSNVYIYDVLNSMSSMIIKSASKSQSLGHGHGNVQQEGNRKENEFIKAKIFYKNLLEQLIEQMKSLLTYTNCIGALGDNYNSILKDIMYFKGHKRLNSSGNDSHYNNSTNNSIMNLNQFFALPKDLSHLHHSYYKEYQMLFDDFDLFILCVSGVVNAFERYEKFLVVYGNVHKAMMNSKATASSSSSSTSALDINKLQEEISDVEKRKVYFEQTLLEELDAFIKSNSVKLGEMINTFTLLCGSMNVNERNKLNMYKNYIR